MRSVVVALAAFAAMEPVTAATHRFVMHGLGERLHRSHHRPGRSILSTVRGRKPHQTVLRIGAGERRWEANDAFPVLFAAVVCVGLWIGFNQPGWSGLVPAGIGVTAYGAAYALVHDVYIHRRLRWFGDRRVPALDRLADAHALHHRFGAAPYGMLVPIVPGALRARASAPQRVAAAPRP